MEAPWLSYEGLAIHDGALEAALSHGVVEVERLDVGVAGGSLRATGSYDIHTGKMKGSFTADAIHAEEIPQVPVSIVGTVSGTGDVRGDVHDINSLQGRGTFHVDGLSYNGLTCDSADVQASYSDGIAYIHSLTASIGDGSFMRLVHMIRKKCHGYRIFGDKSTPFTGFFLYRCPRGGGRIGSWLRNGDRT